MGLLFKALFISALFFLSHHQARAAVQEAEHHLNASVSAARKLAGGGCNIFRGKWVYDASYPLYDFSTCPFIDDEFNCLKYKRPDTMYLKYRWQPFSCNLQRFNGLAFLEKFRGKKIMFVGDSLSFNMWQSLSCMIHSWVPKARTSLIKREGLAELIFLDYGVRLLLYRTPYLVDIENQKVGRVLKLDSIRNGNSWRGMDMLIFNSWHWWTHTGRSQPGRDWNAASKSCKSETQPYFGIKYPAGTPSASVVVNKVLSRIKKPVYLLDITLLSQYRKDGHPTYYSRHNGLDCSHWCLPGVPDTWNLLLYSALFS
ncbi:hypothetical protein DH2020_031903 [Rehmannia glutinosa]|uniref:Trichome birefringence-like N-terminal domain-containing protein n=1 Tax=Rehmannia glutinosa TaxID=99300 RepID=A0ABR0VHI3_REHGL